MYLGAGEIEYIRLGGSLYVRDTLLTFVLGKIVYLGAGEIEYIRLDGSLYVRDILLIGPCGKRPPSRIGEMCKMCTWRVSGHSFLWKPKHFLSVLNSMRDRRKAPTGVD